MKLKWVKLNNGAECYRSTGSAYQGAYRIEKTRPGVYRLMWNGWWGPEFFSVEEAKAACSEHAANMAAELAAGRMPLG